MNALFRKVVSRNKDSLLKESLQTQLVACVKDVQLDHAHCGQFQSSSEAAGALCTVLEAIFIHGIKETFADKMAIAMGDPDSRPEPNFWPALLVFSHREIIDQIGRLNFVSTDVGRCRAWLRIALNESLLTSYLQSMLVQNNALNAFYKRAAFLRDKELLDMFITLVSGVENYTFNLVCNSSLLNIWTNQPLLMSGVWSPAMKSCPITSGMDIASTLVDDSRAFDEDSLSSVTSISSTYESSPCSSTFDEDTMLKQILKADVKKEREEIFDENVITVSKTIVETEIKRLSNTEEKVGSRETTDVSEVSDDQLIKNKYLLENNKIEKEELELSFKPEHDVKKEIQSYHSLVESYNQIPNKIPDLQDLLKKFEKPTKSSEHSSVESDSELEDKLDFEIVEDNCDPTSIPEFRVLIEYVTRIATEKGLDYQNYVCKTCPENIGINFGEAKVCGLSGFYYCSKCFGTEPTTDNWVIPARILYNWDFRHYSVSQNAANFLLQTQLYPLFDINAINKKIYSTVEEMTQLKDIRVRLKFLGEYLKTCRGNAFGTLQKLLWPRDYLYDTIHHYSLADLIQVPSGALEESLQKAVDLCRSHVISCDFCMLKGFICEVCKELKVIFPFDLDSTYRCKICGAIYHAKCLQPGELCRKCYRIQKRQLEHNSEIQELVSSL